MDAPELQAALAPLLAECVVGFRALLGCDRLTGGASQETWRLRVDTDGGEQWFCLRRSSRETAVGESAETLSPALEARLMQLASAAAVPEPRVFHVLEPGGPLGEGFVMAWLEGETLGGRIAHSTKFEAIRPALARQCGEILGRIHGIDLAAAGLEAALAPTTARQLVEATWQQYRDYHTPRPMLDFAARWLLEHLPPPASPALVHGDFRNGNLMVDPQSGVIGVLDWELACIGDPVRDLGWLCVNSWRFGRSELPVGGFGTIEELLAGYREVSGREVDSDHLRFWTVFGSFWWSVCCLRMADSYRRGENPSLERPAIGRRASEGQLDCAFLLGLSTDPPAPPEVRGDSDLPRLDELVASVAEFLVREVQDQLNGASRYLARVAGNSLDIVVRQLQFGPQLDAAEHDRLRGLLAAEGELDELRWELVNRLRDGRMSLDHHGLGRHLYLNCAGQIAIDQPGYNGAQ